MFNYKTNDAMKNCHYCGRQNATGVNSMTVGMCPIHLKMWQEDIAFGLHLRNRLKDIMIKRGEISDEKNQH